MEEYKGRYLYHYTTVESLALILKYKTIRFSSLSNVDDLEEIEALDLKDYGKYCFVSCYTKNEKEEIPVWNMYSQNGSGVRIRLESHMFDNLEEGTNLIQDNIKEKYDIVFDNKPYEVDYTLIEDRIVPKIMKEEIAYLVDENDDYFVDENGNRYGCTTNIKDLSCIGVCKRECWSFQDEVRYRMNIEPKTNKEFYQKHEQYPNELPELDIRYYDIPIKQGALNNIVVTLGYNISAGNAVIVETLVDKFNKENNANIKIEKSKLKIRPKY